MSCLYQFSLCLVFGKANKYTMKSRKEKKSEMKWRGYSLMTAMFHQKFWSVSCFSIMHWNTLLRCSWVHCNVRALWTKGMISQDGHRGPVHRYHTLAIQFSFPQVSHQPHVCHMLIHHKQDRKVIVGGKAVQNISIYSSWMSPSQTHVHKSCRQSDNLPA